MSRQYSQQQTKPIWNQTDHRLQQIMKKYEKNQSNSTKLQQRRPLAARNANEIIRYEKSPWKNNFHQQSNEITNHRSKDRKFNSIFHKQNNDQRYENESQFGGKDIEKLKSYNRLSNKQESMGYDKFTFSPHDYSFVNKKRYNEQQINDAKDYLKRKQKKYLKTQSYEINQDRISRPELQYRHDKKYVERQWRQFSKSPLKDVEYGPRINNIERINNKIKELLDVSSKESLITPRNQQIKSYYDKRQYGLQAKGHNRNDLTPKKTQRITQNYQFKQSKTSAQSKIQERSKSCFNLKKKIIVSAETSKYMDKASQQIKNFNQKITQFQEQKKKLNISFKNLQVFRRQNSIQQINSLNDSFGKKICKEKLINDSKNPIKCKAQEVTQFILDDSRTRLNQLFQSPYIGLKELDSHYQSVDNQINHSNQQPQIQQAQIMQAVQFKKKKLSTLPHQNEGSCASETKKFLKILSQQVQLDSQFRKAKNWFTNYAKQSDMKLLQDLLCQQWRQMSIQEVKEDFHINFQEQDPFYSYKPDHFEIQDLVANYIICHNHWDDNIKGKWNTDKLRQQNLFEKLDLQKKGFLQIEDLVREINMNQGVFFRNRDLYLIFKRFQPAQNGMLTESRMYDMLNQL